MNAQVARDIPDGAYVNLGVGLPELVAHYQAPGKDFATSLGPCIVTPDGIRDPYSLKMTARINGELWSSGTTSGMHHGFEATVAHFSCSSSMVPGEVIGSGAALNGCGLEFDKSLSIGYVVELEVENIVKLKSRVIVYKSLEE